MDEQLARAEAQFAAGQMGAHSCSVHRSLPDTIILVEQHVCHVDGLDRIMAFRRS